MTKVEITGSSIKRLAADQALPVTVTKAEDWIAQGNITISDILLSMSTAANADPSTTSGLSNGSNMRGIGQARTLVLLDGRRLSDTTIDPNSIPLSALDRTEVLRDGASSVYGSDAIGGVINFVTKKSYTGASITAKATIPERKGGGETGGFSFTVGKGELGSDRWNVYLTGDFSQQNPLEGGTRPELVSQERLGSAGIAPPSINRGGFAFPANVTLVNGATRNAGNPYFSSGCVAPYSVPGLSNTCTSRIGVREVALLTEKKQGSLFLKGSTLLANDSKLSATLLYSQINVLPTRVALNAGVNAVVPNYPSATITPSSPFYPGRGITPAMAGITNETLTLGWNMLADLGPAVLDYQKSSIRGTVEYEGRLGAWDYKLGLWSATYDIDIYLKSGWINTFGLSDGIKNGLLNPFAVQNAAGQDYLKSISTDGQLVNEASSRLSGGDITASRELMDLAGGKLALAVGASAFHNTGMSVIPPNATLSSFAIAADNQASRNVASVYAELDAPITKTLNINAALRTDNYSDFGSTTNPKLSFRWKPLESVTVRGAVGTGFRAPTLTERYFGASDSATGITTNNYNDPLLCPGGAPGASSGGTALPGYNPALVCNARQPVNSGANPTVGPERSKSINFGIVLKPSNSLLISLDYWNVEVTDAIGQIAQATLFTNPIYADKFIRDPVTKALRYVDGRLQNLGGVRTDGVDLTVTYQLPRTSFGRFGFQMDGTYTNSFDTQVDPGGAWVSSLNKFGPLDSLTYIYRWRYTMSQKWQSNSGDWTSTLTQSYRQSFEDLNRSTTFYHRIDPYLLVNWSLAYKGFKNWNIVGGINNVFDRDPPAANGSALGFAGALASPVGRAASLRATYTF
ncbi:MAG: TonB-dependent receptor [Pseudomonadota bacterium]